MSKAAFSTSLSASGSAAGWGVRSGERASAFVTALVGLAANGIDPGGSAELIAVNALDCSNNT